MTLKVNRLLRQFTLIFYTWRGLLGVPTLTYMHISLDIVNSLDEAGL